MAYATVYLIPCPLTATATHTIPLYVVNAIKQCTVFFVENERTARRYLKNIYNQINIDSLTWYTIHKAEMEVANAFTKHLKNGEAIAIISEAGCPAVADPGNILVALAHLHNATVKPLVGPSSILLALMASGFNGQLFTFNGYLPIDEGERQKKILQLEQLVLTQNNTQLFIETPYRNNQILQSIIKYCKPTTLLCVAQNLTDVTETITTKPLSWYKQHLPNLHKQLVLFIIGK